MSSLNDTIQTEIFDNPYFVSATFSGINRSETKHEWTKITVTPVIIQGMAQYQFNSFTNLNNTTKNLHESVAKKRLVEITSLQFSSIYIRSENQGLQIQITKKGKTLIQKHKKLEPITVNKSHDREKKRIQSQTKSPMYLQLLGLADKNGNIRPNKQKKYVQIDEFIKIVDTLQDWKKKDDPIHIVDCGSGNAYLSFAVFHYFHEILKKEVHMTGIDLDAGAVERATKNTQELGWNNLQFEVGNILSHTPKKNPNLVIALHACDSATDEALFKSILWQADHLLSVPCCHQHLQKSLEKKKLHPSLQTLAKHSVLKERLCDVTTDTFRAQILELMGYQVKLLKYVSTEHTSKNIMIKASKKEGSPDPQVLPAYEELKQSWGSYTPVLEKLLTEADTFPLSTES